VNSRSRVHAALRREPVDRVPVWIWFHPETAARLAAALEIPASGVARALGDDIRQAWVGNNFAMEGIVHEHEGETHTDAWGIEWIRQGGFNQVRRSPLQGAGAEEIARYRHPFQQVEDLLTAMESVAADRGEYFIGCDISPCLLELLFRVRGMEATLFDLAADPVMLDVMIREAGRFAVALGERACERFRLDWLWTGDDVGGQRSMMISPGTWRSMIRPHLAAIFEVGKKRGLWVAYHSCGAIRPIIPDLIDMGLDVLNPIQPNCPGMDPRELKREFGEALAFMGGVDTQELLPRGTADEVYRTTRELIDVMTSGGGGYILAASHAVPPETPLRNIFALYEAAGISKPEILDRAASLRASLATGLPD
jgi:uroporphyrinogen decarboxylase